MKTFKSILLIGNRVFFWASQESIFSALMKIILPELILTVRADYILVFFRTMEKHQTEIGLGPSKKIFFLFLGLPRVKIPARSHSGF